jgi:hypothetical protein
MAFEAPLFMIPGQVAAADLSAKQYYCVKANGTNNQVALCDADGEIFLGVLQNKPASGVAASVMAAGVTKVVTAEALTAGDYWGTGSAGTAKKVDKTATGADLGDFAAGQVLQGAGSGEIASVTIGLLSFVVPTA